MQRESIIAGNCSKSRISIKFIEHFAVAGALFSTYIIIKIKTDKCQNDIIIS